MRLLAEWQAARASLAASWHALQEHAPIGAGAALAALLTAFWSASNAILLFTCAGMMLLDMAAGGLAAHKRDEFDGRRFYGGLVGKTLHALMVAAVALMDIAFATLLPGAGAELVREYTPWTKMALGAVVVGEFFSIIKIVRRSEGNLLIIAIAMRMLDRFQLGREPPIRRHYDQAIELSRDIEEFRKEIEEEHDGSS